MKRESIRFLRVLNLFRFPGNSSAWEPLIMRIEAIVDAETQNNPGWSGRGICAEDCSIIFGDTRDGGTATGGANRPDANP